MLLRTAVSLTVLAGLCVPVLSVRAAGEDSKPDAKSEAKPDAKTPRDDKAVLEDLKKAAEDIDFRAAGVTSREQAVALVQKRADEAAALVKQIPAGSPLRAEALRTAIKPLLFAVQISREPAARDRLAEVTDQLKTAAQDDDGRAAADLARFQADWFVMLKDVKSMDAFKALWAKEGAATSKRLTELVAAHPKDKELAEFALQLSELFGKAGDEAGSKAVMDAVAKAQPDNPVVKEAAAGPLPAPKVGEKWAISFTPVGSDKQMSMKDLEGKVVVIDFWATWCPPCRAEMPHMKELYAKFKDKGVEFVGISLDQDQKALTDYTAKNIIKWPQVFGPRAKKLSDVAGVEGIPTLFILDKKGVLRSMEARGRLDKLIPELLEEK
jgi:thiol-disulfide isomerase/thioredoxin